MEAGEKRLSRGRRYRWKEEGHFFVLGQWEGNRNSDVISKREKGGKQRVSLALSSLSIGAEAVC